MRFIKAITLLFFAPFIFSASALDFVSPSELPKWFNEAMQREADIKNKSTLTIEQFNINREVLGKLKLVEKGDSYWYYTIEIGSSSPVECYAFTEFDGPSNSLHAAMEVVLDGAAEINKKALTNKFNYAIDGGIIGDTPYISLDTLYVLGSGKETVIGLVKGISARTSSSLQICLHHEVGYRSTFLSVFEAFLQAFIQVEAHTEFFEAIYSITLNGVPVGYNRESYTKDGDGDVEIFNDSAFLTPVDASSLARSDTGNNAWSRPDGSLINQTQYTVDNGQLSSKFSLSYQEGAWYVEGELQGKPIGQKLTHDSWLLSSFGSYIETAALMASEQELTEFHMWIAEADPTSAVKSKISKIKGDPNANFRFDFGPMVFTYQANEKGVLERGTMEHGPLKLNLTLIYSNGEPILP